MVSNHPSSIKDLKFSNFIILALAGFISGFGISFFLSPVELYDTGIAGTSMLVSGITPDWISLPMCLIVLNIPLFLYGLRKQGIVFTIYSIYTVVMFSLFTYVLGNFLPFDFSEASPLVGSDLLLCAIFGGLLSGLGTGLSLKFEGAMDGIEVLAIIFHKKLGISVGSCIMVYNCILYIICGFVLSNWVMPLYSIVAYFVALKMIDFIVDGISRSKSAMIITSRPDEVSAALMDEFESGVTMIRAMGGYSKSEKTILYFIVNRYQVTKLKNLVHKLDTTAYVTIAEVSDVIPARGGVG